MKSNTLYLLICLALLTPSLFAQAPSPIPEEARKHFVKGATLFKEAKTADDFVQVVSEFKQATELAPQWPDARYNLGLAKEAAGDYPGAMADLKLYQQFKLPDTESRTVQDKIYELEAKQEKISSAENARREAAAKEKADSDRIALAAAEKKKQTREVLDQLKGIVGSASYDRVVGTFGGVSAGNVGLNEKEFHTNNWYNFGDSCEHYSFEESRVLIYFAGNLGGSSIDHPDLIGTPNGPTLRDIVWEQPQYDNATKKHQIWARLSEDNGSITWSANRPVNEANYDPNVRYYYWYYKRH